MYKSTCVYSEIVTAFGAFLITVGCETAAVPLLIFVGEDASGQNCELAKALMVKRDPRMPEAGKLVINRNLKIEGFLNSNPKFPLQRASNRPRRIMLSFRGIDRIVSSVSRLGIRIFDQLLYFK